MPSMLPQVVGCNSVRVVLLGRDLGPVRDPIDASCGLCCEFLLGARCMPPWHHGIL